ncbi:uncharacterized protein JCM6883_001054 [Sporobolomyces salmoneus]|uniref:uncharacterized protein n=1 Tax=Sporobolomyces salmoneus TaxID=183962 RepID=UPI003171886C
MSTSASKNAFAFMMQPRKKPSTSAEEGGGGGAPRSPSKKKDQQAATPAFTTPVFKGSGLGAGPRHAVDPKDQPWVEK